MTTTSNEQEYLDGEDYLSAPKDVYAHSSPAKNRQMEIINRENVVILNDAEFMPQVW
jgi:hypothetical protein